MEYEKELRKLIGNLLKEHRTATDRYILCPKCQTWMEFGYMQRQCLRRNCEFMISRRDLPSPDEIESLIREVKSEKKIEAIKNLIREILKTK